MHDLRFASLSRERWLQGEEPLQMWSINQKLFEANAQLAGDFSRSVFSIDPPPEGYDEVDLCGRMYAAAGAGVFSAIAPMNHPISGVIIRGVLAIGALFIGVSLALQHKGAVEKFITENAPSAIASFTATRAWQALSGDSSKQIDIGQNRIGFKLAF